MKYKMVCIDMDGTLLGRRKGISEENKRAIKEAHDMGVEIVVTTGRLYNNALYFSKFLGVDSPVVAANGAIVIDQKTNEVIYECSIPKEECIKILEILIKYNTFFQFNTKDTIYCNNWLTKVSTQCYMTKQVCCEHLNVKYINVRSKEEWIRIFNNEDMDKSIVISPFKLLSSSTKGNFSILCCLRICKASSKLVPSLEVTKGAFVITSEIFLV